MTTNPNTNIRKWYHAAFPTDDLWTEIRPQATFMSIFQVIDRYGNFYKAIGEGIDSIIRERIFQKLAGITGEPYEVVYETWLRGE